MNYNRYRAATDVARQALIDYGIQDRADEEAYWRAKILGEFRALVEADLAEDPPMSRGAKARVLRLLSILDLMDEER